jgi:hypothetical protein
LNHLIFMSNRPVNRLAATERIFNYVENGKCVGTPNQIIVDPNNLCKSFLIQQLYST